MLRDAPLPPLARLLGLAGLIPFVGLAVLFCLAEGAWLRGVVLQALAAYGATILAFLGAVHWGFALAAPDPRAERARLIGGVLPSLWAWGALLLPFAALSCLVLALGLAATLAVEEFALSRGLTPAPYQLLRRWLTAVAGLSLAVAGVVALG